jgi:hypothetical protein
VTGDCHAQICEGREVKLLPATRPQADAILSVGSRRAGPLALRPVCPVGLLVGSVADVMSWRVRRGKAVVTARWKRNGSGMKARFGTLSV